MNVFVTASNGPYSTARKINVNFAKWFGKFDKVLSYDVDTQIDDEFRRKNDKILKTPKGAGLWLWKIYFIHKAFYEECEEGDVLFYLDASAFFYKSVKPIIAAMDDDIYACEVPYLEESFNKRETLQALEMDTESVLKSRQFQASFLAVKKTPRGAEFLNYWYKTAQEYDLIGTEWNESIQHSAFIDHRYDQALFSLTCKRFLVKPQTDPTVQGLCGYPYIEGVAYSEIIRTDEYSTSIFLHRSYGNVINIWLRMILRERTRRANLSKQKKLGLIK